MVKTGIIFPKLTDKQLITKTSSDSRSKKDVREKMEKSRGEIQLPRLPSTSGIMDIEKRTLGPLVEWQIHRATQHFPHALLRQQETLVTDWLHRNHFKVSSRLPRLDPLVLTTRGADFGKFMNFIYPAPFSLRFKSDTTRRRTQDEREYTKIREPCARFLRSKRSKTDLLTLNPVVRVGGGYKRLTWKTWEVLPAIGQNSDDVTAVFTCTRCGANLAIPHEIIDNTGQIKLIITYPSNCANCGKEVNTPRSNAQTNGGQQYFTKEEMEKHLGHQSREEKQHGQAYHGTDNYTYEDHVRTRFEDERSVCSDDTGFSFTPDGKDDSFFITEADGTIKRIKKSLTNPGVQDQSSNDINSRDEMQIIEHRDPESGMKVRVRRKGGKKENSDNEACDVSGQEQRGSGKSGMEPRKRENNTKGLVIAQGNILSDDSEDSDEYSAFLRRQKKEQQSFHKRKSRPPSFHYLRERKALSDSELLIPERYLNFLKRKRVSSKKRNRRSSRHQSYANGSQQGTGYEEVYSSEDWKRSGTTVVVGHRTTNSSTLAEMHNRSMHRQDPDNPDGYMADSEEDSLLKLQAQLLQLKLDARKKTSGKDNRTSSRAKRSKSRNRSGNRDEKAKTTQLTKKKSSLSIFGLDSDSWDSDESLHFDPLSDEYYSSDSEEQLITRRYRAASLDEQDLPSHRNSLISFHDAYAAAAGSSDERKEEEKVNAILDSGGKRRKFRHSFKRKPTNKTRKAVPTLPIGSHRSKFSTKWDEDDLSESDIHHLTAQMQMSFKPKETTIDSDNNDFEYCKGQYCYRCGSYVNECEATCSVCGTHCKRPDAPCKVCRDTCERCGKPKVRCESRDQGLVAREQEEEDLQAKGIGMKKEKNEKDKGMDNDNENDANDGDDEGKEGADAPGTAATENTFDSERTSISQRSSKRGRKMIVKKNKKSGFRYTKRGNRQRTSTLDTMDSMETVIDNQPLESEEDVETGDEENNHDIQDSQDEDSQGAKPQPSKYTKSKKKFKPSKMVVSQKVIYRNSSSLSQCSTMDQTIGDDQEERDEKEEETDDKKEDKDDENDETQAPKKLSPQEDQKETIPPIETKMAEQLEAKKEEAEKPKEEEKPKPQIPKPKLRGVQRVNAAYKERVELNKRLQAMLKDALQNVIAEADIRVRRDSTIDYLAQYRLVDRAKIEVYGRAFALEDEDERGIINYEQMLLALEGVPTIQGMSRQQMNYVLQVLEINTFSRVSFKMFAVINALCERVTSLDLFVKDLVEGLDLSQTEWKLDMYKNMFYVAGNRSLSFISPADLRIELKAGGLNQNQEDHVIKHITQSSENGQISFLDYMAYLPLFLSIHQNICSNALDMSRDKYTSRKVNKKDVT
ncbi:transcriptional regulator ATRX-like [Actinia tenebrosa]|uniref:Transcriptional regulator ATRX-like n=1 Tax=Actinia tenebrosa TaxID=6105 RepID=A0A6P8J759_ACTTE|nr:transcriptional regulator ATRX-like [Actinia tenebrosa]